MPQNLRKALTVTAFLFLLAALFPIQKETIYKERMGRVDVREVFSFRLVGATSKAEGKERMKPIGTNSGYGCACPIQLVYEVSAIMTFGEPLNAAVARPQP
jgi:hypothetical protein